MPVARVPRRFARTKAALATAYGGPEVIRIVARHAGVLRHGTPQHQLRERNDGNGRADEHRATVR